MFLNQRDNLKKGIREDPVGKITFKEYTMVNFLIKTPERIQLQQKIVEGVFRTLSNIYTEAFLRI